MQAHLYAYVNLILKDQLKMTVIEFSFIIWPQKIIPLFLLCTWKNGRLQFSDFTFLILPNEPNVYGNIGMNEHSSAFRTNG